MPNSPIIDIILDILGFISIVGLFAALGLLILLQGGNL